jgi:hypothetical protein
MAEDVNVRVLHRRDQAPGHFPPFHAQLRVGTGHHDVEAGQQLVFLVERAVLQDVDLDPGEQAERGEVLVHTGDDLELAAQVVGAQPMGDREPRAVVGQGQVLVPQRSGRGRHLVDRAAAVGPVRMAVAVPAQRLEQGPDGTGGNDGDAFFESLQVPGHGPRERFVDHRRCALADAWEGLQAALLGQAGELARLLGVDRRRGAAEGLHLVGLGALRLKQVGDAPQRLGRSHAGRK